jgi:hypothetical protein
MFKQGVPLHPCCGYPEIWLQSYSKESGQQTIICLMMKTIC